MLSNDDNGVLKYYTATTKSWKPLDLDNRTNSLSETEELITAFNTYNTYMPITIKLNQNNIIVVPDTPYILQNQKFTLNDSLYIQKVRDKYGVEIHDYYQPTLLNFFVDLELIESQAGVIRSAYIRKGYDQLSGYFYRPKTADYIFLGNKIKNDEITDINYYNSLNVVEIIKEKIKQQLYQEGLLTNRELHDELEWDEYHGLWLNDNTKIVLEEITNIVVETQEESKIIIEGQETMSGPAGRKIEKLNLNHKAPLLLAEPKNISPYFAYFVPATITFDYVISFKNYIEPPRTEEEVENNES